MHACQPLFGGLTKSNINITRLAYQKPLDNGIETKDHMLAFTQMYCIYDVTDLVKIAEGESTGPNPTRSKPAGPYRSLV